ncbi:MAG: glycosyltransferase family 4 protein, partial [Ignavibacteria bacterium]|nr:glycosyltransferase family 4 protein [Ignavibacteria bacterium]
QQRKEYSKQKKCSYKSVLMIASYRKYKGIYEFAELARLIPDYTFNLVLSTTKSDIIQFKKDIGNINNLNIFPLQTNLHPFYSEAKLLLQLSHPESWIETFGLTILEAMIYGIPAIVPFVGGPTELVENGKNGYLVNPHNLSEIKEKILYIMENSDVYNSFSICAFEKAKQFNLVESLNNIETYLFL